MIMVVSGTAVNKKSRQTFWFAGIFCFGCSTIKTTIVEMRITKT